MARRPAAALVALAAYVAAAVWLTWPLANYLETHMAEPHAVARFDALYTAWALAWETHALAGAPAALLDANIYHPTRRALLYGPTSFGALPWFAPTFLASGNPALATNLMFLASLALTAWTLHLAVLGFTGSHAAGVVAASVLLTNRWLLWLAPTAPNYTVLQYWPLIVLLAARPAPRLRVLVPLVVLQVLTDPIYLGAGVLPPLGLLTLARIARPATRAAGFRLAAGLVLVMLCVLPVYAGYAAVRAANPHLAAQTVHVTTMHWTRSWWQAFTSTPAAIAVPALGLLPLGALAALLGARPGASSLGWCHGLLWTVTGLVLALPLLLPPDAVPLLSATPVLHAIVSNAALRVPARLAIGSMIGLALLAGVAFAACMHALRGLTRHRVVGPLVRAAAAVLLAIAIYGEYASGTWLPLSAEKWLPPVYPLFEVPRHDPELLRAIDAIPGPLLELPVTPREAAPFLHAQTMYRSIFHWHPLVNGYSSYWPASFARRMKLAAALPDARALAALRAETGVTMVLLRWSLLPPAEHERWGRIAAGQVPTSPLKRVIWTPTGALFVIRDDPVPPPP